jgi:predicted nucleic acid-binding protein
LGGFIEEYDTPTIASTVMAQGAALITHNRLEFDLIDQLRIIDWY